MGSHDKARREKKKSKKEASKPIVTQVFDTTRPEVEVIRKPKKVKEVDENED